MATNVNCTILLTQFCRQNTVSRRRAVKYWALTFDTNLMVQFSVPKRIWKNWSYTTSPKEYVPGVFTNYIRLIIRFTVSSMSIYYK